MAIAVIMPRQGQSVETCIITKWFRKKGETVKTGDILFSYETDKAAFDVDSPADGTLLEILYYDGAEVPVLVNVAFIGEPGEAVEPSEEQAPSETVRAAAVQPGEVTASAHSGRTEAEPAVIPDSRIRISPRARRFAENNKLNYSKVSGSGQN